MKFNPLDEVGGIRIVVVDDSIVRGNTMRQLVAMLLDAGAAEVHVRISSPPVVSPCFYGIDMADEDELAAAHRSVEEMRVLHRRDLAPLPLRRGHAGSDRAARGRGVPRLLHARVPDARAAEAPRSSASSRRRPDRHVSRPAILHAGRVVRHHQRVEDTEATQLMLETLFVVRADPLRGGE